MSDSFSRPGTNSALASGGPGAFGVSASRIDFWLFVVMLALALVGVGLGVLDQLSLYLALIPIVMIALWVVFKRTTRAAA